MVPSWTRPFNPEACKTGLNLIMFQTAIWFEIPYSLYTIKQAAARIRRPTSQADVIEEIYINVPDTIVEDALALVMEKFTALIVRGSGNFTAELIGRVMRCAQGHTDDLETIFARYNELEETREISITGASETDPNILSSSKGQAERVRQIVDEFNQCATKAADWTVSQLSLF